MSSVGEVKSNSIGPSLWSCFVICFLCSAFAGLTSTLMSVYLPVVVRSLSGTVTDDQLNYISAYINSIYLVGWAIGGFVWGWISDRIGRVKAMAMAAVFMGLFTILIRYAPSWEYVVILRLLSGFSVGGILVLTPTLLSEVWPEKSRSIVIGIDSIGFPVGIFSSGLVNYVVADWRGAFMVGVIPISLGILSIWLLIESESWKQAKATLSTGAAKFTNLDRSNLVMGSIIFGSMLI